VAPAPKDVGRAGLAYLSDLSNDPTVSDFVHPNDNLKARILRALFVLHCPNSAIERRISQLRKHAKPFRATESGRLKNLRYGIATWKRLLSFHSR
jgi:hypothetical protein